MKLSIESKWSLLYRIPSALVLSYLIGYALSFIASMFIGISYAAIGNIISNMFNFSANDVANGILFNRLIPGLGTLGSIVNSPDFGGRLALVILIIGTFIAVALLYGLNTLVIKLANENKIIAVLCTLIYSYWFLVAIYANFFLPEALNFWYCVDAVIVLFVTLGITIEFSALLFDKYWE